MLGFAAIGSGADATNNSLAFHSFNNRISLGLAIYYICAAKFMSEGTHGVGKNTSVVVGRIVDNNKVRWVEMSDLKLKEMRQIWEDKGRPRAPDGIEKSIADSIEDDSAFRLLFMR